MFSILLCISGFTRGSPGVPGPGVAIKDYHLLIHYTTHELNWNRKGSRPVLGLLTSRGYVNIYITMVGNLPSLHVEYAGLTANKLEHTTESYLLNYTIIYRFIFTKTLFKNWISWQIIRFSEISSALESNQWINLLFYYMFFSFHSSYWKAK